MNGVVSTAVVVSAGAVCLLKIFWTTDSNWGCIAKMYVPFGLDVNYPVAENCDMARDS